MATVTQTADSEARVCLPLSFANSTVLIEQVSTMEVRIRKIQDGLDDEPDFVEESNRPLTDRDRDLFLSLLDSPPLPHEALKKIARRHHLRRSGDHQDGRV